MRRVTRMAGNTSRTRIRGAGRNIAVRRAVAAGTRVGAEAAVVAGAGASRAARATMPIYRRVARTRPRPQVTDRPLGDQPSQEAIISATNTVATTASARNTHTAPVNSAVAGSARGRAENRVDMRLASRAALVRAAAQVAVAAVKADSRGARAPAVAEATAARAVAVAFRAWVDSLLL